MLRDVSDPACRADLVVLGAALRERYGARAALALLLNERRRRDGARRVSGDTDPPLREDDASLVSRCPISVGGRAIAA